eukprot:6183563-Pleurochrysis_carterae.AAC.2
MKNGGDSQSPVNEKQDGTRQPSSTVSPYPPETTKPSTSRRRADLMRSGVIQAIRQAGMTNLVVISCVGASVDNGKHESATEVDNVATAARRRCRIAPGQQDVDVG